MSTKNGSSLVAERGASAFVDVRDDRSGKLLFRYDAKRKLVEIVRRGERVLVDLTEYEQKVEKPKN